METIQELVQQGKQFFENKDYPKAERYFREVLKSNRKFADIHNLLGVVYTAEGKFESAIQSFREALKINPRYTEALLNLAVLYNDLGNYPEAKKLYGHLNRGAGGNSPACRAAGKVAIEPVLKGRLSNMHADIGDIYRNIGLYEFAVREYQKALEFNPTYADIRTKLGIALRENGNMDDSMTELKKVVREKPAYLQARTQLGISLFSAGKQNDAKKEWEAVLKKDPQNESAKIYLKLVQKK